MGAMLRISPRTSNSPRCFARARHRNTARGSAYRRGQAIIAGTVQLSLHSAGCVCETGRPRWKDQIGLTLRRQAACGSADRAHATIASHPAHYALSSKSQIRWLRADATAPERCQQTGKVNAGFAAELAWRSASGTSHNTHCPFGRGARVETLPHKFFSCRRLPALRDPSARNLCQTMCRCVLSRCFTVTLTANPHLRARAGSQRASSQASFTPTPPLRL